MNKMQEQVALFSHKNNLQPKTIFSLLDLMSELGESAKEILKMTNYGQKTTITKTIELELEVGDALFSLLNFANSLDIDAEQALLAVLKKYQQRIDTKGHAGSTE